MQRAHSQHTPQKEIMVPDAFIGRQMILGVSLVWRDLSTSLTMIASCMQSGDEGSQLSRPPKRTQCRSRFVSKYHTSVSSLGPCCRRIESQFLQHAAFERFRGQLVSN